MTRRAARLMPVVAALSAADRGRLARCLARISGYCAEADSLRAAIRSAEAPGDAAGMQALARWQALTERRAREAEAEARAMEAEAASLRRRLARSMGRERAVEFLAASEARLAAARSERRAEDMPPRARQPRSAEF